MNFHPGFEICAGMCERLSDAFVAVFKLDILSYQTNVNGLIWVFKTIQEVFPLGKIWLINLAKVHV